MAPGNRIGFKTIQDWVDFVRIQENLPAERRENIHALRKSVYAEIESERGRPLLVYFADIDNPLKAALSSIDFNDIDGFTDLVNQCERSDSVDVLLHSAGGSGEITERIVATLRGKFAEVHFLIPHSAYSAATMLALSGDSITLYHSAALGPIDPQINGAPAASILNGFEKAVSAIETRGPAVLSAYLPLIERYHLHLLEQCDDATNLSKKLVRFWLKKYMFKGRDGDSDKIIEKAVNHFSDYGEHLTHGHPIGWEEVKDMGLKIYLADGRLAELLRDAYIMLKGYFNATPLAKLYENSSNLSFAHAAPMPASPDLSPEMLAALLKGIQGAAPTPTPTPPAPAAQSQGG